MLTLLYFLIIMTVIHFIYEGIICPTLLLFQEYRLVSARHYILRLRILSDHQIEDNIFEYLSNFIETVLISLRNFDHNGLRKAQKTFLDNQEFSNFFNQELTKDSEAKKVQEASQQVKNAIDDAFFINYSLFSIPVFLCLPIVFPFALLVEKFSSKTVIRDNRKKLPFGKKFFDCIFRQPSEIIQILLLDKFPPLNNKPILK